MAVKLKVFSWSDGFHAFTVAVSSKPKALQAWGIGQDIFRSGLARQVEDGPAHDAALAAPGTVIQTGEAVDVGALAKTAKPKAKAWPDTAAKARVVELERSLKDMDGAQKAELAALDAEIRDLQTRRHAVERNQGRERQVLVGRLKTARSKL